MYENVLIGFDGSPESYDALQLAKALAAPDDWSLTVVSAIEGEWFGLSTRLREDDGIVEAARIAAHARPVIGDRRFKTDVAAGSPARVVSELARKHRADLIAIGSTNRDPLGGSMVGVGARMFEDATTSVAIASRGFARFEHVGLGLITVGYDGTVTSQLALLEARKLASWLHAEMRVVTVIPELSRSRAAFMPALRQHFEGVLERGMASLTGIEAAPSLVTGDPAAVLAEQGIEADLLVLGSRGRVRFRRAALGTVSATVTRAAPCPVIVVPRAAGAGRDRAAEAYTQTDPALGGQPTAPTRR